MTIASGASVDAAPFVFHDASGRRWSRIKRVAMVVAAAAVVLGGGVLVAVATSAPGRAPFFSAPGPQQVPDWQVRDGGGAGAPGQAAASAPGGVPARPGASAAPAPAGSLQTSPAPSPTPKNPRRRPKPTPSP